VASSSSGLVDIVREFLEVEEVVSRMLESYGRGKLAFEDVRELVSDSEASPLFRLKERCHALFRPGVGSARMVPHREVLFDLAVGSLFHEAMKFREDFYQREVYGPRVQALRDEAGEEAEALFQEFEKIQAAVSERLEEGLHETQSLVARTREQLRVLLVERSDDGHVTRFLLEHRARVEQVFGEDLDSLLAQIHGEPARGYAVAGRSYLVSGYYADAERCLAEASVRGGDAEDLESCLAYARGMAAYLRGRYAEAVAELACWVESSVKPDPALVELAHTAVSKIGDLVAGRERDETVRSAGALLERLGRLRGEGRPSAGS
jgi:tetratricopeptide (TPR) repeat protein